MKTPGFRQLINDSNLQGTISVTGIYNYLISLYKETDRPFNGWTHYTWEEDGQQFSMWCTRGLCTGDKGIELYSQALKEYERTTNSGSSDGV